MQHILPKNRQQYEFISLEDLIDKNNPIRFVDAFVEKLELDKLGFKLNTVKYFVQKQNDVTNHFASTAFFS